MINSMSKEIVRLSEQDLHKLVETAVKHILHEKFAVNENGGMVGGAAANASGFMNGANNAQTSSNAQFDVSFGNVQRKKGYSPKGKNGSKMTEVDMTDAMKRHDGKGGSISIPKNRV